MPSFRRLAHEKAQTAIAYQLIGKQGVKGTDADAGPKPPIQQIINDDAPPEEKAINENEEAARRKVNTNLDGRRYLVETTTARCDKTWHSLYIMVFLSHFSI